MLGSVAFLSFFIIHVFTRSERSPRRWLGPLSHRRTRRIFRASSTSAVWSQTDDLQGQHGISGSIILLCLAMPRCCDLMRHSQVLHEGPIEQQPLTHSYDNSQGLRDYSQMYHIPLGLSLVSPSDGMALSVPSVVLHVNPRTLLRFTQPMRPSVCRPVW